MPPVVSIAILETLSEFDPPPDTDHDVVPCAFNFHSKGPEEYPATTISFASFTMISFKDPEDPNETVNFSTATPPADHERELVSSVAV